jgi:hypothetical protein
MSRMDESAPDLTPESPDSRVCRVLYNKASGKTILEVESRRGDRCHRVYWKEKGATSYERLGTPGHGDSYECIVTGTEPILYLCLRTWIDGPDGKSIDIYYRGVLQADLRQHTGLTPLPLDDILPAGTTIHSLLRVDDGGDRLQAIVRSDALRGYAIVELDLVARRLEQLDTVPMQLMPFLPT